MGSTATWSEGAHWHSTVLVGAIRVGAGLADTGDLRRLPHPPGADPLVVAHAVGLDVEGGGLGVDPEGDDVSDLDAHLVGVALDVTGGLRGGHPPGVPVPGVLGDDGRGGGERDSLHHALAGHDRSGRGGRRGRRRPGGTAEGGLGVGRPGPGVLGDGHGAGRRQRAAAAAHPRNRRRLMGGLLWLWLWRWRSGTVGLAAGRRGGESSGVVSPGSLMGGAGSMALHSTHRVVGLPPEPRTTKRSDPVARQGGRRIHPDVRIDRPPTGPARRSGPSDVTSGVRRWSHRGVVAWSSESSRRSAPEPPPTRTG